MPAAQQLGLVASPLGISTFGIITLVGRDSQEAVSNEACVKIESRDCSRRIDG
jgi:hypothetical protein